MKNEFDLFHLFLFQAQTDFFNLTIISNLYRYYNMIDTYLESVY